MARLAAVQALGAVPASDVKKRGWRGLMRRLGQEGPLVVTNHDEPQAVIVPVDAYRDMVAIAEQARAQDAATLEVLRKKFDARLATLQSKDAGARLRALARRPVKLRGKVKAGDF